LGLIIGQFKTAVTKRYNRIYETTGVKVWQRGYYERIVRNERELNAIRQYILDNLVRRTEDHDNLDVLLTRMNGVPDNRIQNQIAIKTK
jgi:putative transposase